METSINGVSADEIATMRARLLLLDEPPESRPHIGRGLTSLYLNSFEAPLKVEKGIFPEFWQRFHGDATRFVPLARLLAVYYLKLTNSCEHVLDLRLGPVQGDRLPVHFRGQRHRVYTNVNPAVIEVDGVCHLRS